jgi:hypothetical protein
VEWSLPAWLVSVAAVGVSGTVAWLEGNWTRRPGLAIGFSNHGGMWGDLLLLPVANAAIVPYLSFGPWVGGAAMLAAIASALLHSQWYSGHDVDHSPEHMWPARRHGSWHRDLSWAGRLHVAYVVGELTLLAGFLVHTVPPFVVLLVCAVFTIHVPIGLLQPRWYATRRLTSIGQQPLLVSCLALLWIAAVAKL